MKKNLLKVGILAMILISAASLSSCKKDTCKCTTTVIVSGGNNIVTTTTVPLGKYAKCSDMNVTLLGSTIVCK